MEREDERRLGEAEIAAALAGLEGWAREGEALTRTYRRRGWKDAIAFVGRIAEAADRLSHHPDVHVERYRTVRVVLTTHATGGISAADLALARAIDDAAA